MGQRVAGKRGRIGPLEARRAGCGRWGGVGEKGWKQARFRGFLGAEPARLRAVGVGQLAVCAWGAWLRESIIRTTGQAVGVMEWWSNGVVE